MDGACRSSGSLYGQEEKPRKEGRYNQGTAGVLEGPLAMCGIEKPRRGTESAEGRKAREKSKGKKN